MALPVAARSLVRSPLYSLSAVGALAVGLGFAITLFSLVDRVLLQPLPFPQAERLVTVWTVESDEPEPTTVAPADFLDWKDGVRSFERAAAYTLGRQDVVVAERPESVATARVTPEFFRVLEVPFEVGHLEPETVRQRPLVVLGHEFWQRRFGGDPEAVGRPLRIDGTAHEVAAVLPVGRGLPEEAQIWVPAELEPEASAQRDLLYLRVVARLRPGVEPAAAQEELDATMQRLALLHPASHAERRAAVVPLHQWMVGSAARPLAVLMAAAIALLVLACLNQANLLLARARTQRRDTVLRVALGAGWRGLLRHTLGETLTLSLVAMGVATWGAYLAVPLLARGTPFDVPRLTEARLDGRAVLFGLGLALFVGTVLALIPAVSAARLPPARVLGEESGGASSGREARRSRYAVAAGQTALALVLVVGCWLMVESVRGLQRVDPGFATADRLALELNLPADRYGEEARRVAFLHALLERMEAMPGVRGAAATLVLPLEGVDVAFSYDLPGRPAPPGEERVASFDVASPGYFELLEAEPLEGREFNSEDRAGSAPAVIVNRALAERHWPEGEVVGKHLFVEWGDLGSPEPLRVVGVVNDLRQISLEGEVGPALWVPYDQFPVRSLHLLVHADGEPAMLTESLRRVLLDLDPELPVSEAVTLEAVLGDSIARQRFTGWMLAGFAAAGLLLASLGIYGATLLSVNQRFREMGVRMALGASRWQVARRVLGEAVGLAAVGIGVGTLGAVFLTRGLEGLLYGVSAVDPLVFVFAGSFVLAVACAASAPSALRAARIRPATVLRRT